MNFKMRVLSLAVLTVALGAGCSRTVCDELEDEYEANGCSSGANDDDGTTQDFDCSDGTEAARAASCALENTVDVCNPTVTEEAKYAECLTQD